MSATDPQPGLHTDKALRLWTAMNRDDNSQSFGTVATANYYFHTFSIMLEIRRREGHTCTPIIVAVNEELGSIRNSIRHMFSIEDKIALELVWEGSGRHFATVDEDTVLLHESTPAILRLLMQRGGVDKLVAKEVVDGYAC